MDPEAMLVLLLALLYFVVVPALTYLFKERRHRYAWRRRWLVEVPEHGPGGSFRDQDGEHATTRYLVERRGAPLQVKVVAVASLVLGHMFVPGLLMGLLGLFFAQGVGLVAIPGLVLAARIYRNAFGLLRCEPLAATEARLLRVFSIVLNAVVMVVVSVIAWKAGGDHGSIEVWLFFWSYGLVSLLHAHGLGHAADAIDAVHQDPVPVTAGLPADCAASTRSSRAPAAAP
jgi:hypothetical protein